MIAPAASRGPSEGPDRDLDLAAGLAAAVRRDPRACVGMAGLVRISGVGGNRLNALIRRHFHTTPAAFLADARVAAARELLADGRVGVSDAAFAVGFVSVASFHEQFRRRTGLTPVDYRIRASPPLSSGSSPSSGARGRRRRSR